MIVSREGYDGGEDGALMILFLSPDLHTIPQPTARQAAPKPGQPLLYRSTAQTLLKIASEEGVPRLWKVRVFWMDVSGRGGARCLPAQLVLEISRSPFTSTKPHTTPQKYKTRQGFGAYFLRGGGHTVFMFLFYEQYKKLARKFYS